MCPLVAHRLKRIAISSKRLIPFFPTHDANDQSLAYVYGRETKADADIANVLTMDEARRIASNIAKVLTPDDTGANWQLRAEWTFLFPTH